MSFDSLLIHTATLLRQSVGGYEDGTPIESPWTSVGTFPCRLEFVRNEERIVVESDQRALEKDVTIYAPPRTTADQVRRSDRIRVDVWPDYEFEVVLAEPVFDAAGIHHYEINAERVVGS